MHHLNLRNIYHRDLKLENFLIKKESNGKIYLYLTDFGCSKNSNPDPKRIKTEKGYFKGTVEYSAPEKLYPKKFLDAGI